MLFLWFLNIAVSLHVNVVRTRSVKFRNCFIVCETVSKLGRQSFITHVHCTAWRWMDRAVFYVPANTVYGRWFLQVKRPNQQYQSTKGTNTVHQ